MPNLSEQIKNIKPKTHIAILLDESSSMGYGLEDYAVKTFNEQVEEIQDQSKDQEVKIYLTKFGSQVNMVETESDIEKVNLLTESNYKPRGGTALYDAIGLTVKSIQESKDIDENTAFLMVIITDGHDTSSRMYNGKEIKEMCKTLEETGKWTFSYLGMGMSAEDVHQKFGFSRGNIQTYSLDAHGMQTSTMHTRKSVSSYLGARTRGVTQMNDYYSSVDINVDPNKIIESINKKQTK